MLRLVPSPQSGPNAGAYLNIEGARLSLPVVGLPPECRTSPVEVWLDFGGVIRWAVSAATYEDGAKLLLERVEQLITIGPAHLVTVVESMEDRHVPAWVRCDACHEDVEVQATGSSVRALVEVAKVVAVGPMRVYLVQQYGCEYSNVVGVYRSETAAIQAVRRRMFSCEGFDEGAPRTSPRTW